MRHSAVDAAIGSDNLILLHDHVCRWRFPVPPEVIAWTLLFVVAFALIYRFFAWIGQRRGRASSPPAQRDEVQRPVETVVAAPVTPLEAELEVAPTEPLPPSPLPLAAAPEIIAPPPLPVRVPPPVLMPSTAVTSARIAAAAVRTAVPPSVAATLPPEPAQEPVDTPPPLDSPEAEGAIKSELAQDDVPKPEDEPERTEPVSSEPLQGVVQVSKSFGFRSSRIGREPMSLGFRLRDALDRKSFSVPKTVRGSSEPVVAKGPMVSMEKDASEKASVRRIGSKIGAESLLASAQARTRIIGAPQRPSRILGASDF